LLSWTAAEEKAHAGDIAVGSGLQGVEDVKEEVGLLSSGSDGEWRPVVLNGELSGRRRWERAERSESESEAEKAAARRQNGSRGLSIRSTCAGIRAAGKWGVTASHSSCGLNGVGAQFEGALMSGPCPV
jgi:hypothetical protein